MINQTLNCAWTGPGKISSQALSCYRAGGAGRSSADNAVDVVVVFVVVVVAILSDNRSLLNRQMSTLSQFNRYDDGVFVVVVGE